MSGYEPSFPHGFPHPFGGEEDVTPPEGSFADLVWRIGPPWLQRATSRKILSAIGAPLDTIARAMSRGVRARFPQWDVPDALILLGRERRIRRGPAEGAGVFAPRLIGWLDDHRGRGGAHALVRQLRAFWAGTDVGDIEVVSYRGVRHSQADGDTSITRDVISWGADGTGDWCQFWAFLHVDADPSPVDDATYLAVPTDWTAAHVLREHVVILWGHGRLWDYPPPSGDWDAWESGLTWDEWDAEAPITITHEEG